MRAAIIKQYAHRSRHHGPRRSCQAGDGTRGARRSGGCGSQCFLGAGDGVVEMPFTAIPGRSGNVARLHRGAR